MTEVVPFSDPTERLRAYPLVFVDDLSLPELAAADRDHLVKALRFTAGDQVNVGDGAGRWRPAALIDGAGNLVCGDPVAAEAAAPRLVVAFTPTKRVKPEGLVQKLTELGVDDIVILRSDRSIVTYDPARSERLLRKLSVTVREACLQSRQPFRPTLHGVLALSELLEMWPDAQLCDPSGTPLMQQECPANRPLSVAVGPEGGWSDRERDLAPLVGLPGRVLRSETAVLAGGVALAALRESRCQPK